MQQTRKLLCTLFLTMPYYAFAKCGSVNYSWGADSLATMHDYVVTMMLYVLYVCYAIASVLAIVSALQIYIKMNTGEDGITKSITSLVGACLFHNRRISCISGILRLPDLNGLFRKLNCNTNTSIHQKS